MSQDNRFGGNSGGNQAEGNAAAGEDLGFFASGPSGPAPAAQVAPPVQAPPQSQFGAPPPPAGPFGPPAPFGGPGGYPQQPYAPAQRRGLPAWAIVAICVPTALVILGILASIAVPVFLSQRDKAVAASTSVSMPTQIAGMAPSTDSALRQQVQSVFESMPACGCYGRPVTSVYTDAGQTHALIVGAAKMNAPFHSDDREDFVRGFWHAVRTSSGGANVGEPQEQDPGKLGGTLSCAPLTGGVSGEICIAVDAGSFFFVTDTHQGAVVDRGLPTTAREAIIHRT